jgi:DNA-binding beta-propeller fold protein YncE
MRLEIGELGSRTARLSFVIAIAIVLLAALAFAAAPSQALIQRGYALDKGLTIGTPGSGAGQLKSPAGVAVNQTTGDIYVVDSGNNRVDQFSAAGTFKQAWGWGVKNGAKEFQICTTSCQAGLAGHGKGELHGAGAIAVDNAPSSPSRGDVYVETVKPYEEEKHEFEFGVIAKFSAEGVLINEILGHKKKGESLEKWEEPHGVSVGPLGELWVYNEEELFEFTNEEKNSFVKLIEPELNPRGEARDGLAVGSESDFYLAHSEASSASAPTVFAKDLVIKSEETGEFEGVPLNESIVPNASSGVTISPTNQDVLVDTVTSVTMLTSSGEPVQSFGGPEEGGEGALKQGTGLAVNTQTKQVLVADAAQGELLVFEQEPLGPPKIEDFGASGTSASQTQLTATIAPGGAATSYWFRYAPAGAVPPAGQPCASPCVELPLPHAALAEGAEADYASVIASPVTAGGLSPSTVYGYRVFAANEKGTVESGEQRFRTRPAVPGETLLDGRSWQLVSPPNKAKNGAFLEAPTREGGLIQAAADGHAITYVGTNATEGAQGNRAPEPNQLLSVRSETGEASSWSASDINTPNNIAAGISVGSAPEYKTFSADLSLGVVDPDTGEEPKLSPLATEHTIYLRNNPICGEAPEKCYTPLVNSTNDTGEVESEGKKVPTPFGRGLKWLDSNEAATATVISAGGGPLTKEPAALGGNLYELLGGSLKLVNALSNGTPLEKAALGTQDKLMRNAISADGSRVVFSAGAPTHLYERNTSTGKTVQVDKPEEGLTGATTEGPTFQAADTTGKRIFFTDPAVLTHSSTAVRAKPDLYVCEVEEAEGGEPFCKLTDLTVAANPGEPANVQGAVAAVAADGSDVFFVADGELAPGAVKGNCVNGTEERDRESEILLGGVCNLYVVRRQAGSWGTPKQISTLSIEDEPDWGVGASFNLGNMTSRVSPNGEWFTFMSDRRLPTATNPAGYNNHDVNSGRPDEEVFLYNAREESLRCASCDPTGARPVGVHDEEESGEGIGLLVDRPLNWVHRWIAANIPSWTRLELFGAFYQPRYLLNSGRLFFNTPQTLVSQDKNGTQDVYEYEPVGTLAPDEVTPDCTTANPTFAESSLGCLSLISSGEDHKESAFLDASESGADVFFDTAAQLTKADNDSDYDVYDAAICGQAGASKCVPAPLANPPVCGNATECRGEGSTSNPTVGTIGPGSVAGAPSKVAKTEVLPSHEEKKKTVKPLSRAQKYAKALAACRRIKNKHKRSQCQSQAKKKYGPPAKKGKKARNSSHTASGRGR